MAKRKKVKEYQVHWSMDTRGPGILEIPAEDVEGMSDDERQEYFQQCVDEEVEINGPCGCVDSVDEVEG
jgi:hypothetical protein